MSEDAIEIRAHGLEWLENTRNFTTEDNDVIEINCIDLWALTYPTSKPCLLKFTGMEPYVYLQIPDEMSLTEYEVQHIINSLVSPKKNDWPTPISAEYINGMPLYYYQGDTKINCFRVRFQTRKILRNFVSRYHQKTVYLGGERVYTRVWENGIDTIQKILTITGNTHTSWFTVMGYPINDDDKESTIDEYEVDIETFKPIPIEICEWWQTNPKFLAFDLECYSSVRGHMPIPVMGSNCIFIATIVTERLGLPETRKKYAIVYGVCRPIEGVEVIIVKDEWSLIETMCKIWRDESPDIISGYNINGFDIPYIDLRIRRRPTKSWPHISRFKETTELVEGITNLNLWYDKEKADVIKSIKLPGVLVIDTLHVAKAECRGLHQHTLNVVAHELLGKAKEDIGGHERIFESFEAYIDFIKCYRKLKRKYPNIIDDDPDRVDWSDELKELHEIALDKMTEITVYGVTDSDLIPDIWNHLGTWTGMVECCNVVNCAPRDYYSRGQQIKCMNQIFRRAASQGFIMTRNEYTDGKHYRYEGGYVGDPDVGKHEPVVTLDFNSLYPSIMIWLNICYTTYLPPHMWDTVPIDLVNRIYIKGALKDKPDLMVEFRYVKPEVRVGILPQLVSDLLMARKKVKDQMKVQTDKKKKQVLDARQLGLKLSANSVSPDTPILCLVDNKIRYSTIENLFTQTDETCEDNEICIPNNNIKVWSDMGWTDINYIIRHPINTDLKRINTHTGCVDVTDEHSLLTPDGSEVKTTCVTIGDELLHFDYPLPDDTPSKPLYTHISSETILCHNFENLDCKNAYKWGFIYSDKKINVSDIDVLNYIINSKYNVRLAFFLGYCVMGAPSLVISTKDQISSAGLTYIARSLGYKASIFFDMNDNNLYKAQCSDIMEDLNYDKIKNITILPYRKNHDKYIYDIETKNHHFAAGIGNMIVHNSMYGFTGVGYDMASFPCVELALSVTGQGRNTIIEVGKKIEEAKYGKIVYGDSVIGKTPIICRYNGKVVVRTIDNLPQSDWRVRDDGKDTAVPNNLEVWTENGFTNVVDIIRHKTNKKLYRITTHTGSVIVTEDHSLLDANAEKIRPTDVSIGTKLLSSDLPILDSDIDIREAWVWGLFYGDGSCGNYKCKSGKKYTWAINNQNLEYLNKAKDILSSRYNDYTFRIMDTFKSSAVYKLTVEGKNIAGFVKIWRDMFYDNQKYKKVPDVIFESNHNSRLEFFNGYYAADGDKDANGYIRFCNKGQIGAAGLYLLSTSLGYKVSINTRKDKPDIYRMTLTTKPQRKPADVIKKIEFMGYTDAYVYDLETASHHFQAGVGRLIVHNTDSVFVKLWNVPKSEYSRIGSISKEMENFINEEFEGTVMHIEVERHLITFHKAKKQYASIYIGKDGNVIYDINKMYIKGMSPVRGDRIPVLKELIKQVIFRILRGDAFKDTILYVLYVLKHIIAGEISADNFYAIMKVGFDYANKNARMKLFSDKLRKAGRPVIPGEKLKFITTPETYKGQKLGDRTVLDDDYEKNPDQYQVDYNYYIRNNIANQLDDIIEIEYGPYIDKYCGEYSMKAGRCQAMGLRRMVGMIAKMHDYGHPDALQKTIDYITNLEAPPRLEEEEEITTPTLCDPFLVES